MIMKLKNFIAIFSIILMLGIAAPQAVAEPAQKATVVFNVQPEMHCQNCENKIKTNLRFEKGVSEIKTDIKAKTVTIVYDTRKTDPEKLAKAFEKIGYKATEARPEK